MKVVQTTDKYIQDIDGNRVNEGDVCFFWAQGHFHIGRFKGFGKRGAVEFKCAFPELKKYKDVVDSYMPATIDSLIVVDWLVK